MPQPICIRSRKSKIALPSNLGLFGWDSSGPGLDSAEARKQIELCKGVLRDLSRVARPHEDSHSYRLKHVIERATGHYIANGSCIAAALELGIPHKRTGGLNSCFALCPKAIAVLDARSMQSRGIG